MKCGMLKLMVVMDYCVAEAGNVLVAKHLLSCGASLLPNSAGDNSSA